MTAERRMLNDDTDPDRLITVTELALSWRVHPNTVYEYIRKGILKVERLPSNGIRIKASEARRCGPPIV